MPTHANVCARSPTGATCRLLMGWAGHLPPSKLAAPTAMGPAWRHMPSAGWLCMALLGCWRQRCRHQCSFLICEIDILLFRAPNIASNISVSIISTRSSQWCTPIHHLRWFYFGEKLNILQDKWKHQNSWNLLESNPITVVCDSFHANLCNSWWLYLEFNDHPQRPIWSSTIIRYKGKIFSWTQKVTSLC
jgi:hypothetical protein